MTLRAQFVKTITTLMEKDDKIVLLLGDIGVYGFRDAFQRWPARCINMGVCEQASVSFAAGLAMAGLYPVYHTIDAFLVRRAYEQVYLDFGVQKLPGLFVTVGGARDYEKLGPTHMCAEGLDMMRHVPEMVCAFPASDDDLDASLRSAVQTRWLAYVPIQERPMHDITWAHRIAEQVPA